MKMERKLAEADNWYLWKEAFQPKLKGFTQEVSPKMWHLLPLFTITYSFYGQEI